MSGPSGTADAIRVVRGRAVEPMAPEQLAELIGRHDEVVVDLGTGDGRFVLREARANPRALVIGIDPVADAMAESARRAARKPARGGAPNALFLVADAERMPEPLAGVASLVAVNFPWGALLAAVARPEPGPLRSITRVLRPGGRLVAFINLSAADDSDYSERLELPPLDPGYVEDHVVPGWRDAGLTEVRWRRLGGGEDPAHRTSWGRRLVRGSRRETLLVEARRAN